MNRLITSCIFYVNSSIKCFCSIKKNNVFTINEVNSFPFLNSSFINNIHLVSKIEKEKKVITPKMSYNTKSDINLKPGKLGTLPALFSSTSTNPNENIDDSFDYKHILIAGKSNVGKSSLINCLIGSKQVISSKTPGKTNTLTFIRNPVLKLCLIDSPGYGFANRSTSEIKSWERMMQDYISKANNLIVIILLIDSEQGITQLDEGCIKLASFKKVELVIVFTKSDKLINSDYKNLRIAEARKTLILGKTISNYLFFTSVKEMSGINELKAFILSKCQVNI